MKQFFLSLLFILTPFLAVMAQDEEACQKPNVLVTQFEHPQSVDAKYAALIRNSVMSALQQSKRATIIDATSESALAQEQKRREAGVSSGGDMERTAVQRQQGANFVLTGTVDQIDITKTEETETKDDKKVPKRDGNGNIIYTYKAVINFTLKLIDSNEGTMAHTEAFRLQDGGLLDFSSPLPAASADEAVSAWVKTIPKKMRSFIGEAFPLEGKVWKYGEVKKDRAETVYIKLGSDQGVHKGDKFDIRALIEEEGIVERRIIGLVEVVDVQPQYSLCKVKEGKKAIYVTLNAQQYPMIATSK